MRVGGGRGEAEAQAASSSQVNVQTYADGAKIVEAGSKEPADGKFTLSGSSVTRHMQDLRCLRNSAICTSSFRARCAHCVNGCVCVCALVCLCVLCFL